MRSSSRQLICSTAMEIFHKYKTVALRRSLNWRMDMVLRRGGRKKRRAGGGGGEKIRKEGSPSQWENTDILRSRGQKDPTCNLGLLTVLCLFPLQQLLPCNWPPQVLRSPGSMLTIDSGFLQVPTLTIPAR